MSNRYRMMTFLELKIILQVEQRIIRHHVINRNCSLPTVLVPKVFSFFFLGWCFKRLITIASLFVPASLVGNADISGSL